MLENVEPLLGELNRDIEYLLPKSQEKIVTPSQEQQIVIPDEDYTSLSKVIVESIPGDYIKPTGTLNVDENGEYDVNQYEKVNVSIGAVSINNASYLFYNANRQEQAVDIVKLISSECEKFSSTFENCTFNELPFVNTSKGTDFSRYAFGCSNITKFPQLDTSNGTKFGSLVYGCTKLLEFPLINTSKGTNFDSTFQRSGIQTLPQLDTSNATTVQSFLRQCPNLISVPLLNLSSCTMVSYILYGTTTVTTLGGFKDLGKAYKIYNTQNYSNYKLDLSPCILLTHESLMNVINNLYDLVSDDIEPQQLVLGATNLAKLEATEEGQQAIITAQTKGWNVS